MNGIYLAAYKAYHSNWNIVYQDINGLRDVPGDMLEIDLNTYDFIIATPPCNYWSKARGNNKPSKYALETKHLLPDILKKLVKINKPFIVENVRNRKRFINYGLYDFPLFIYHIGRHTYWTNIMFNPSNIIQKFYFEYGGKSIQNSSRNNRQGGLNVHNVIEYWLENIKNILN